MTPARDRAVQSVTPLACSRALVALGRALTECQYDNPQIVVDHLKDACVKLSLDVRPNPLRGEWSRELCETAIVRAMTCVVEARTRLQFLEHEPWIVRAASHLQDAMEAAGSKRGTA